MAKNKSFSLENSLSFSNVANIVEPAKMSENINIALSTKANETNKINETIKNNEAISSNEKNVCQPVSVEKITAVKASTDGDIKTTSISIRRTSKNFLAYIAKMQDVKQTDYIISLIENDLMIDEPIKMNFDTVVKRRESYDMIIKTIQLTPELYRKAHQKAASKMIGLSEYVDELLQKEMLKYT